jgi:tetratricopeptide (TPR) repeat protein
MRRIVLAGILAVAVLAALAALFLILRRPSATDAELQTVLKEVDAAIAGGYMTTARDTLAAVNATPTTETGQIRLLKRSFQVSMGAGDFSLLADMAGRALARYWRSPRIRAIAAYGSLRAGRLSEAERILARNVGPGPVADSLKGEALLRRGARWPAPSDDLVREILSLQDSTDPVVFAGAALRAGEKRLALDAALLAMQQGSTAAAVRLVGSDLEDARFDEPAGLILYDAGNFAGAAARMERLSSVRPGIPGLGLQIADIKAAGGDNAAAEAWLIRALPLEPAISWTPFADLALFAMRRGETALAARRLEDGLAFFPHSRELRLLQARIDASAGNIQAAETLLASLLAERPSDGEAALLLLALQGPEMSPEASRARLWKLFDLVPSDPAVFDALASMLIAARDWEGMRIALRQYEASGGQLDARHLLFQGLAAAMSGDDAAALAALRRSDLLAKDGTARFDLALVMLRRGAARDALAELDAAAAEVQASALPGDPGTKSALSRIETLRGAAHLLDGDTPGAGSALSRALSLDSHNLRAGLLMRKLEAGGQ